MNYHRILQEILNVGEMLMKSGAEIFRTEDSLYRMCESYQFLHSDIHVIPTNIQATIETPDGELITQIRHIKRTGIDLTRLDKLNNLCRYICMNTPTETEIKRLREEILAIKPQARSITTLAAILGGGGFTIFFGGNAFDALIACFVSSFIALGGMWLSRKEDNTFIYNLILAFFSELFIIWITRINPHSHSESITDGIVMMLISALSTTNGIRDMFQKDILSGIQNILASVLGSAGIASGIALAMTLLHGVERSMVIAPSIPVQLVSCTVACIGFALWFHVTGISILYNGVGAFFTWLIYAVLCYRLGMNNFYSTLIASCFVAAFAYVMARVNKMPSTVFLTSAIIPLIPGPNLYYMMYAVTKSDSVMLRTETIVLLETCLGIALGFLIFDAIMRYTSDLHNNSIFSK